MMIAKADSSVNRSPGLPDKTLDAEPVFQYTGTRLCKNRNCKN